MGSTRQLCRTRRYRMLPLCELHLNITLSQSEDGLDVSAPALLLRFLLGLLERGHFQEKCHGRGRIEASLEPDSISG